VLRGSKDKEISSLRIGITGSPGTGKKSVARALGHMTGLKIISLNTLAIKSKSGKKMREEFVVNIQKLKRERIHSRGKIIVGHLIPFVIPHTSLDFVAILRCSPSVLRKRYLARGYSEEKIRENIEAELLDLVSFSALKKYGKQNISEFDTTRSRNPNIVAGRILETIRGKRPKHYGIAKWSESASKSTKSLLRIVSIKTERISEKSPTQHTIRKNL
jgi:adenylate kinase